MKSTKDTKFLEALRTLCEDLDISIWRENTWRKPRARRPRPHRRQTPHIYKDMVYI